MLKLILIIVLSFFIFFMFRTNRKKPAQIRSRKRRILDRIRNQQ